MSEWELRGVCPKCAATFTSHSTRFLDVCPECGEPGEWSGSRPYWKRQTMRYVHVPFPGFRWLKPSTWGRGEWRWEVLNDNA